MDLFPISCSQLYDDPCGRYCQDQLNFFDPCDCFNLCPSTVSVRPTIYRCTTAQPRCRPQISVLNSAYDAIKNKKNLESKLGAAAAHPEKYSIHVNVAGYDPHTIQINVKCGKLIIEANQQDRQASGDYNIRQFRKTYELPRQADVKCMTANVMPDGTLVVDIPIRTAEDEDRIGQADNNENQSSTQSDQQDQSLTDYINLLVSSNFNPRLLENDDGTKILEMTIDAKNCPLEDIDVAVKNNELTIRGECRRTESGHSKRSRFSTSTTLPDGAQVLELKKELTDDGQLKIEIPLE